MVIESYAKINLSLVVNKKLQNGLHDLQSIFCLINLKDKISIKKNKKKDKIYFKGPYSKDINRTENSVSKLLRILRKKKLISDFYSVTIFKKIPVFAGLGGGTGNAAIVLKHLVKKRDLNKKIYNIITKTVGSDLRLFLYKFGYLQNIKTVFKIDKKYKLNFLLVYPKIKNSTKKVFSKVKYFSYKKKFNQKNFKTKKFFINYLKHSKNDLQSIVEKKHIVIKKLLKNIREAEGCYFSRMTGSGSVCYGLFADENCSKVALKKIRKKYPKFWFSIAKTI